MILNLSGAGVLKRIIQLSPAEQVNELLAFQGIQSYKENTNQDKKL